jgi:hypothetical protein
MFLEPDDPGLRTFDLGPPFLFLFILDADYRNEL